jgi:hypothetical protein
MGRFAFTLAAAAAAFALTGATAQAEGHSGMPIVQAYNGPNYCPAGLQPIVVGGVVCCGTPNTAGYYEFTPGVAKRVTRTARVHRPASQPSAVAVEGQKGVIFR